MTNYNSLIFSEFRLVVIADAKNDLKEENIVKAMTINEELKNIGYALAPASVLTLARSASLDNFFETVKNYIGSVNAKPMYPGFPDEVLKLTEAQFRFHQMLHYMSTYGMELFMNEPVMKGWLPESDAKEREEKDNKLLSSKVIGLIEETNMYEKPLRKILGKAERMTEKEKEIVYLAVRSVPVSFLSTLKVKFKQNMMDLFYVIFSSEESGETKLAMLSSICQHTGDVWKCVDYTLTREKYHFRTSQKRLLVKLLEMYSVSDFESNIILSDKKAERVGLILNYLDFNTYSKSANHRKVVDSLRSGELRSWESGVISRIKSHAADTISYIAKRPGVLLRKLAFLVRQNYSVDDLTKALSDNAADLSTQTLISVLSYFGRERAAWDSDEKYDEACKVYSICESAIRQKLASMTTAMKDKKVFIDYSNYAPEFSEIQCKNKSSEGGYVRSGLALKIPAEANKLRFFVYWNDKRRVDVDLHASGFDKNGNEFVVGWNGDYVVKDSKGTEALAFSGDITHSDAAEYVDINTNSEVDIVSANINLFSGARNFKDIDECFVGIMGVNKLGQEVRLYDPANCFFSHYLTGTFSTINYGYIDVTNRLLVFDGSESAGWYDVKKHYRNKFSLDSYMNMLMSAQGATVVDKKEDAEFILVMEKATKENEISIIDANFFVEEDE